MDLESFFRLEEVVIRKREEVYLNSKLTDAKTEVDELIDEDGTEYWMK